jgi:hypothetical protein
MSPAPAQSFHDFAFVVGDFMVMEWYIGESVGGLYKDINRLIGSAFKFFLSFH